MGLKFTPPKKKNTLATAKSITRKNIAKWQWYLVTLIVLSPIMYFAWIAVSEYWFISAKGFVSAEQYTIRAHESAHVEKINVQVGDSVEPQTILVVLKSDAMQSQYTQIENQLEKLVELKEGFANKNEEALQKMKEEALEYMQDSEEYYHKFEKYYNKKLVSITDLQSARQMLHESKIGLYNIEKLIIQNSNERMIVEENSYLQEIRELSSKIEQLKTKLDSLTILAQNNSTVSGVVIHEGEFVTQGQAMLTLSTQNDLHIEAYLDSKYLAYIHKNKQVDIKFSDGKRIKGKIENNPTFAKSYNDSSSVFKDNEAKVVIIIEPLEEIPSQYKISGAPVKIEVDREYTLIGDIVTKVKSWVK